MMISNLAITFSEQNQRILNVRGDENDKSPGRTSDKRKQACKPVCSDQAARHRNTGPFPEFAGEAIFALQTCGQSESFPFLCFCGQLRAKAAPHSLMWCRFVLIETKSFSPESLIRFATQNDYFGGNLCSRRMEPEKTIFSTQTYYCTTRDASEILKGIT